MLGNKKCHEVYFLVKPGKMAKDEIRTGMSKAVMFV
jgi:hypothetical protein